MIMQPVVDKSSNVIGLTGYMVETYIYPISLFKF